VASNISVVLRRDYSDKKYCYLVLTTENKYEWGSRENAINFSIEKAKYEQRIIAFRTTLEIV